MIPPKEKKVFQITPGLIFTVIAGLLILVILIFIIRKLADNFYRIKRKFMMHHKVKTPYKEIKKNKRFGRKNR